MTDTDFKEIIDDGGNIIQKESLKLTKNSRGYNWEIKILEINPARIEEIDNEMQRRFSRDDPI